MFRVELGCGAAVSTNERSLSKKAWIPRSRTQRRMEREPLRGQSVNLRRVPYHAEKQREVGLEDQTRPHRPSSARRILEGE